MARLSRCRMIYLLVLASPNPPPSHSESSTGDKQADWWERENLLTGEWKGVDQGEGTQRTPPPPCSRHRPGSERLCNAMEAELPHSPFLPHPASWLWNSRQTPKPNYLPNTRLLWFTDRNCQLTWHRFQPQGGKSTPYTVYAYTTHTFSWHPEFCGRIFGQ